MSTATIDQFLSEISQILQAKDGTKLQNYLIIEPPYSAMYISMVNEMRQTYPKGREDALEMKCSNSLPLVRNGEDDTPWSAFFKFMVQYFSFLRDVNIQNLLDTYNILSELVQKANSALGHQSLGHIILPTVVTFSRMLSRLAIGLDKQPQLIAHLTKQSTDEGGARETLPERAANIVRQAFVTCLNDRSGGIKDGKPDGKKKGIYKMANLCLKVLFQCGKTRSAEQIFTNVDNQSPPLAIYPRAEGVTYLYYLGRFLFSNNHFFRAQVALQEAYNQCRSGSIKQRRLILIYLIASRIILGQFPTQALYKRPEASGLADRFHPICVAIQQGDITTFRMILDFDGPHADWFTQLRILLQLRNRCEVLVWRSLVRKTFILNGVQGGTSNTGKTNAPTFRLQDVLVLAQFLEKRVLAPAKPPSGQAGQRHTNWIFQTQSDFQGYIDPDFEGIDEAKIGSLLPNMLEIECILASLVDQGLLNGYISHKVLKFAIQGAKKRPALEAGFPNVWQTISARSDDQVPGWKMSSGLPGGGFAPGMVVNLAGARPAGFRR